MKRKDRNPMQLRLGEKAAYGSASFGLGTVQFMCSFFLVFFYSDIIGVSPALVGIAVMIGKIWDAVTDPLMGFISDHTKSRFGRRRVYLLFGAIPLGLIFYFLWSPPEFLRAVPAVGLAVYLLIFWLLVNTGYTVVAVPYNSLGAELTNDPDERSGAFAFNYTGQRLGMLAAIIVPNIMLQFNAQIVRFLQTKVGVFSPERAESLITYLANQANVFRWVGALFGLIIALLILHTFKYSKERIRVDLEQWTGGFKSTAKRIYSDFLGTMKNDRYRILIIATLISEINGGIVLTLMPYVLKYWLKMEDLLSAFMVGSVMFGIFFAFLWVRISKKIGKKNVFALAMLIYAVTTWCYLLMGPGLYVRMAFWVILWAASLSGYAMVYSLIADIVDYDELATGHRHEGSFFGLYTLAVKIAAALGILLVGLFLQLTGFENAVEATPGMITALKWFVGPLAGTLNLVGLFIFMKFKYSREEIAKVNAELEQRRGTKAST